MSETLYIQINRNIQVDKREITIGDVAALLCKNAGITARVKTIKLITLPDVPKRRVSFSVMTVMEKIEKIYPDLQLVSIGESDFIVDYIRQKKKSRVWQGLMVAFVSVFTFVGSAYAIMAYNNDVSTNEIFEKVWNEKVYEANNTVMVHIRRLRGKMKEDTRQDKIITTVWGVGYKIEK